MNGTTEILYLKILSGWHPIGCLTANSYEEKSELLQTSTRQNTDSFTTSRPTKQSYSISFSGFVTDNAVLKELKSLKKLRQRVDWKIDNGVLIPESGTGLISELGDSAVVDEFITFNGTILGVKMPREYTGVYVMLSDTYWASQYSGLLILEGGVVDLNSSTEWNGYYLCDVSTYDSYTEIVGNYLGDSEWTGDLTSLIYSGDMSATTEWSSTYNGLLETDMYLSSSSQWVGTYLLDLSIFTGQINIEGEYVGNSVWDGTMFVENNRFMTSNTDWIGEYLLDLSIFTGQVSVEGEYIGDSVWNGTLNVVNERVMSATTTWIGGYTVQVSTFDSHVEIAGEYTGASTWNGLLKKV